MTIRPSLAFSAMRAMEGRFNAEVTHRRQTMEPVGPLSLARWHTRPIIGTDRPTKGFRTAPRPCWAKRSQHLVVGEAIGLAGAQRVVVVAAGIVKRAERAAAEHDRLANAEALATVWPN